MKPQIIMKNSILFLVFWICLIPWEGAASPMTHLKRGDKTAQEFLNQLEAKKQEAGPHPFSSGPSKEAGFSLNEFSLNELEGRAQFVLHNDPQGEESAPQMIVQSSKSRLHVKIDPQKDPLMTESQKAVNDPLTTIGGKGTHVVQTKQAGIEATLTCEEPGDDSLESCINQLIVKVEKIKVRKEWEGSFHLWLPTGKKKYLSLACAALRGAVQGVSDGNITGAYKACMKELTQNGHGCCVDLPNLKFPLEKIKEVNIERTPIKPGRGRGVRRAFRSPFQLNYQDYRHKEDWGRKKSWYDYQPRIKIIYEEDDYKIHPDVWTYDNGTSNCNGLEARVDQGLCHYVSRVCTQGRTHGNPQVGPQGGQTRIIEGIPITRPCWEQKLTYACAVPSKDDCGPLRARGCVQINSSCKQKIGNSCVVYTQTYQCKGGSQTIYSITGGNTPFCLDGNCRDQSWETNDEMMSSVAQLSLLKELQGKFNSIFKGDSYKCSKHILHFKDCCGSGKGWGKRLGLGGCEADEKLLQKKREARLCHYVGTYCDEKLLGKCIKKKSSFCCFGSKLLKAFQEQGRAQIGLDWGKPKHPLCRGFTIEEIQRIDFSKLDLSEVFEDLIKNYTPAKMNNMSPTTETKIITTDLNKVGQDILHKSQGTQVQDVSKRVGERVEILKKGMTHDHQ